MPTGLPVRKGRLIESPSAGQCQQACRSGKDFQSVPTGLLDHVRPLVFMSWSAKFDASLSCWPTGCGWVGKEGEKRATHLQPKWHTVCTRLRTSRHHHPRRTPATRGMTHPSACPSLRHTSWVAGATTAPARPTRQMGDTLDCCWHPFSLTGFAARVVMVDRARRRDARRSNI